MYISYIKKNKDTIVTRNVEELNDKNIEKFELCKKHFDYLYKEALFFTKNNMLNDYTTKYIPKHDNQYRRIDIPSDELKNYQKALVEILCEKINFIFPKMSYAYIKGRNAKMVAEEHTTGAGRLIKLDIKNFFRNCTLKFIIQSMMNVYPFCLIDANVIETILKPCMVFYDDEWRLPQGAPSSPVLSNIAMIPIDYDISCEIVSLGYRYTRFADDIFISSGGFMAEMDNFVVGQIYRCVNGSLKAWNSHFRLNKKKTKVFDRRCGNVWLLGMSVGTEIKIGNKRKQLLKATIWSFLNDCKNGKSWSKEDTLHMIGIISYSKYIEPMFVNCLISKYEKKTHTILKNELQKILC